MKDTLRTVVYDAQLNLEAYRFAGIVQPFPNHFHEHYVIGFVEQGERMLSCKGQEYLLHPGDILLFNPGDNHACTQSDDDVFAFNGLNLPRETMLDLAAEVTGSRALPGFGQNVLQNEELLCGLRTLHRMILHRSADFGKEEQLLLLLSEVLQHCGQPFDTCVPECPQEVEKVCGFIQQHFAEHLTLEQLCHCAGLSRSTLLRAFTRAKGITPYRYLETVRINAAKALLAQGVSPAEAALRTGFSDQSHFTNYFSRFIGLAPGVYREIFSDSALDTDKEEPFHAE